MPKHGKKYVEASKMVENTTLYEVSDALALAKKLLLRNLMKQWKLHLDLALTQDSLISRSVAQLFCHMVLGKVRPYWFLQKVKKPKKQKLPVQILLAAEDMVAKIQGGWFGFDVAVATPDMMGVVGKIGRLLGPKGLMPNPKTGTVTMDVTKAVNEVKAGKIEYRVDKTGIIHAPIGKASFEQTKLEENFKTLVDVLIKAKPASQKGQYIKSVSVSTTMGPGVKINPLKLQ